ncbi:MAG: hypothetical protein Q8K20_06925 [Gemmobacter sp.]|nr:hypothetical protein [Gemmobacter sp.]
MDRLSIVLTLAVGAMITGSFVTAVLVRGWYSWPAIGIAAGIGMFLTWPVSYLISRRIKRQDPDWDETQIEKVDGLIPDLDKPEV